MRQTGPGAGIGMMRIDGVVGECVYADTRRQGDETRRTVARCLVRAAEVEELPAVSENDSDGGENDSNMTADRPRSPGGRSGRAGERGRRPGEAE